MYLSCGPCTLRPWQLSDKESLLQHANNVKIWLNLRDRFPHPYTAADADAWLEHTSHQQPLTDFALAVGEEVVGGIGLQLQEDVARISAEIGYWLGEAYWGKGMLSAVLPPFTRWAISNFSLTRLYALPFSHNRASVRVLQKAGYRLEGVLRRSALKNREILDQELWAITDQELPREAHLPQPDRSA